MTGDMLLWLAAIVIVAVCVIVALFGNVGDRPSFGLFALIPAAAAW